ncbi:hypothetical protein VSR68_38650 [Paraburkholderia phymatum]|uniref:hypothetical protein n=1 Tax=Paraburkholderia phymatum TaxID=148447 RepID=UPI00317D5F33
MINFIAKRVWPAIVVISTIGGAIAFFQWTMERDEYALEVRVLSGELQFTPNGKKANPAYLLKVLIKNSGRRGLPRDYIYKPVTILLEGPGSVVDVSSSDPNTRHDQHSVSFLWDLLNPNDTINTSVFYTAPDKIKVSGLIRDVEKINCINEVENPSAKVRILSIGLVWLLLLIYSMLATIDATFLVRHDVKLQRVFNMTRELDSTGPINKDEFVSRLGKLYEDYYNSVPVLFVKPKNFVSQVSDAWDSSVNEGGDYRKTVKDRIISDARYANLYSIRPSNIVVGPLLFGFCFIRLVIALIA